MAEVTVPSAPPLSNLPGVELLHTGTFWISTGLATFTSGDLAAAVGALDCPAIRRPHLKLGHVDPRFDGEPAAGWIDNLATADDGRTLVGDYVGMPGWLGDVLASAYPDRSIEGTYDFICQIGHVHPFVLTAVALLGVTAPGIGTLQSLQDVGVLYGVAAASTTTTGVAVAVTVRASKEVGSMPNPNPAEIAAGVTTEDVRRAYYEQAGWSVWICEMQLDPDLQLITTDDNDGSYARVPVTISGETVTFADAIPVAVTYVDKPAGAVAAASASPSGRLVYASRAESRPGTAPPVAEPVPVPAPVAASTTTPEPPAAEPVTPTDPMEDDVSTLSDIRSRLGLADDAPDAEILAALNAVTVTPEPVPTTEPASVGTATVEVVLVPETVPELVSATAASLPAGTMLVDKDTLAALQRDAKAGAEARARQVTEDRDREIAAAVSAGKIAPARVEHWTKSWDADPDGARQTLASLAEGLVVPVKATGYTAPAADTTTEDAEYDRLFAPTAKAAS